MSRILIVDDDPFTQVLLAHILRRIGYESILTDDGTRALRILAHDQRINAVLSDIRMPKMDGFQLLEELSANYPQLPLILASVHTDSAIAEEVTKRGASFLPKPFTPEQVRRALHQATTRLIYSTI